MNKNNIKTEKQFLEKSKYILENVRSMSTTEVIGIVPTAMFQSSELPSYNTQEVLSQSDKTLSRHKIAMRGRAISENLLVTGTLGTFIGGHFFIEQEKFNNELLQSMASFLGTDVGGLYSGIAGLCLVGNYLYNSFYAMDSATRFREEEKISKYSDDIAKLNCKTFDLNLDRSDAKFYNKSLALFGAKGLIEKTSTFFIATFSLLAHCPKKLVEKISKKISGIEESNNIISKFASKFLPMNKINELATRNYRSSETNSAQTKDVRNFIQRKTKSFQTGYSESDFKVTGDMSNVIDTAYQEVLKRNVKRSLIKAIQEFEKSKIDIMNTRALLRGDSIDKNKVLDQIEVIKKRGSQAFDIISRISLLHNKRVEAKFDHYQAVSQIAMKYKNDGCLEKNTSILRHNIDKKVLNYIETNLDNNSKNNALLFFNKNMSEVFTNDEFKSEKSKNYFLKSMSKIAKKYGLNYSLNSDSDNSFADNEIKRILQTATKNFRDVDVIAIRSNLRAYSQIANNQNIQDEMGFWDLAHDFKHHRVEYRLLENDLEENSYAKISRKTRKV